jgi:hypothetical protein
MQDINDLTEQIIGLGIEVQYHKQIGLPVIYKGEVIAEHRPGLVIANRVVVEVKAVERPHACSRHR